MSRVACGSIVWVELLDPQDRNPKCRPAVVVSPTEELGTASAAWVAGITTRVQAADQETSVELPWHRDGHARTGLKQRSVAVCTWLCKIQLEKVLEVVGVVPDRQLREILRRLPQSPA